MATTSTVRSAAGRPVAVPATRPSGAKARKCSGFAARSRHRSSGKRASNAWLEAYASGLSVSIRNRISR